MIIRLKLSNWKSHLDTELKFSKGVNALLGIIGSGKSSVMDAMCYALFGDFPNLNQRKIKLNDILRNIPSQAKTARLELDFVHEKDVYTVIRTITFDEGASAEIRKNSSLLESPQSQRVTEMVEKILKLDYDVFSRAVYSEQNQLDYFLTLPKGSRKSKIDSLLRIDRFENARKNLKTLLNQISQELNSKETLSQEVVSAAEIGILEKLENEVLAIEKEISSLEENLGKISAERALAENELSKLEENSKSFKTFSSEKDMLAGQVQQLEEHISAIGTALKKSSQEKVTSDILELEKNISELKKEHEKLLTLMQEKTSLERNLELIAQEIKNERENLSTYSVSENKEFLDLKEKYKSSESLRKNLESLNDAILGLEKKNENLLVKKSYSEHILNELELGNECPLCRTELKSATKEKLFAEHRKNLEDSELSKIRIVEDLERLGNDKKTLEATFEKLLGFEENEREEKSLQMHAKKRIASLNEKAEAFNLKLKPLSKEVHELERKKIPEKIEKLQKNSETLIELKKGFGYLSKITLLKENISALNAKIKELGFSEKLLSDATKKCEHMRVREGTLLNEIKGKELLLDEKKNRLLDIKRKKALAEQYAKECKLLSNARESLQLFNNALEQTQESLREEFIDVVNSVISQIWTTLYTYGDISEVKLVVEENDYVLKAKTSAGLVNIDGIVSGGERSLACLALRIAFSLALAPNLSWLVLDEPTHNLDERSIEELAITLKERLPKLISQIFLITHEEKLEGAVTGYLYKLERNKEIGEPTKINLIVSPEI